MTAPAVSAPPAAGPIAAPWRCLDSVAVRRLRAAGSTDRRALPRWLLRSQITPRAHAGLYSRLPAWTSRRHWLEVVVRLVVRHRPDVLAQHQVSADTFAHWAATESLYAEYHSGRRCIVRPVTVGLVAELSERTVQRCRAAARALGIVVDVVRGRMLNLRERLAAHFAGSTQRGLANESALTVPKWAQRILDAQAAAQARSRVVLRTLPGGVCPRGAGVENPAVRRSAVDAVTPTSGVRHGHLSTDPESLVTVTARGEKEPAPPAAMSKRRKRAPSPGYRLAERVVQTLPWARGCPAGRLSGILGRFASARHPWTAQDVVQHVNTVNLRRGWSSVAGAAELRAPAFALLASYLRDADPDADHPRLVELEAADRRAVAAGARAEHRRGGCTVPSAADSCPTCGARFAR